MLFLIILCSLNIVLIGIIILLIMKICKYKKSLKGSISMKENEMLKEILNLGFSSKSNNSYLVIVDSLRKYYKIDYCTVLLKEERFRCVASNVEDTYLKDIELQCDQLLTELKGVAKIRYSENNFNYRSSKTRNITYFYFIPLVTDEGVIGAIYIENKIEYESKIFEVEFFNIVIKNITIVLQNCLYQEAIMNLAMKDNLTKMYNRNFMVKHIDDLLKNNKSIVIAIMDIDYFKRVNDNFGHDFGDIVLKKCSKYIKDNLEDSDEIYRWGGEEFIISFSNQDIKSVLNKLNTIREGLSNYSISEGDTTLTITASFGIAVLDETGTLEECIKKADKGLYLSKSNGRNQINIG